VRGGVACGCGLRLCCDIDSVVWLRLGARSHLALSCLSIIRTTSPCHNLLQTTEFGGIVGVFEADDITARTLAGRQCECDFST